MGLFSRTPPPPERKPDAIEQLCQSLRERPWEWTPHKHDTEANVHTLAVKHTSGIRVFLRSGSRHCRVYLGIPNGGWIPQDPRDAERLAEAVRGYMVALVNHARTDFGSMAKALAQSVIDGDLIAARALVDYFAENPDLLQRS